MPVGQNYWVVEVVVPVAASGGLLSLAGVFLLGIAFYGWRQFGPALNDLVDTRPSTSSSKLLTGAVSFLLILLLSSSPMVRRMPDTALL
jgi:hypothetical protein